MPKKPKSKPKPKKSAADIVAEKYPDMEIVEQQERPARRAGASRPGVSMDALRRKYAGEAPDQDVAPRRGKEEQVEVKKVRPKRPAADPADDPGPRAVIISKDDDEIIGSQG